MNIDPKLARTLILMCLFAGAVLFAASWHIENVQSDYVLLTKSKISDQEAILASIAALTARDGADTQVGSIITDCSTEDRGHFDTLLGRLSELRSTELTEVGHLFDACGNFYSERNAVMVLRLQDEYETYVSYIELLSTIDAKNNTEYDTLKWKNIVELEKKRSELSVSLASIQKSIIAALLENKTIDSPLIQKLVKEGQDTKNLLLSVSEQASTARLELTDL